MKLVTVAEMQAIEREANLSGLTYEIMMDNAGHALAQVIADEYGYLEDEGILGLVGSGNNGGDALVAMAELAQDGWRCSAYLARPRPEDDPLILRFTQAGGVLYHADQDPGCTILGEGLKNHAILLDGILGTGIQLPLKPDLEVLLEFARQTMQDPGSSPLVIAVDCPSGVDCDSGQVAPQSLAADLTVTMAAVKQGLMSFPAYNLVGDLTVVGIGLPQDGEALASWQSIQTFIPDSEWVSEKLPLRPLDAHKGTFGTALIVAGSQNYTGAAWLAGQAAYRSGAGLVTLAIPESLHAPLAGQFPEATWLLLPEWDGFIAQDAAEIILQALERPTAMLLGPGWGVETETGEFLRRLLIARSARSMGLIPQTGNRSQAGAPKLPPLVVDADGLKLLARIPDWPEHLPRLSILTPHPGEMSVLTGLSKEEIQADRLATARRFSKDWGQVIVLKGAFTVIAAPDGKAALIPVATPALARAGTGDVLAGMITGLLAQGVPAFEAAAAGAWIHAQAGLRVIETLGNPVSVLAGELLPEIVRVISEDLVI